MPVLSKKLLRDDDFIADVAHDIMIADWKWNGLGDRIGYRSKCAKWSILGKIKERKRDIKVLSFSKVTHSGGTGRKMYLSDTIEDKRKPENSVTEEHLKNFSLSPIQKEYLLRNINGDKIKDIANDHGVTIQHVHITIKSAKEKIRKYYDKKVAL
jgi:DNA-directed RNA polymerase specialized sigma24 family protein